MAKGVEGGAPARLVGMREVEARAVVLAVGMVEVALEVGMVVAVWAEAGMVGIAEIVTNEVLATEEVTAEEQMASL